jgi:hypothetical protein
MRFDTNKEISKDTHSKTAKDTFDAVCAECPGRICATASCCGTMPSEDASNFSALVKVFTVGEFF